MRRVQKAHVVEGVTDLGFGQRPPQPVGPRLGLVQVDLDQLREQVAQRDRRGEAGETGGDPGVEDAARRHAAGALEDRQVLDGVVQDLGDLGVRQQRSEGCQVDGGGVDQVKVAVGKGELDDPEVGVVGAFPDELGVERDQGLPPGAVDERRQLPLRIDEGCQRRWNAIPLFPEAVPRRRARDG